MLLVDPQERGSDVCIHPHVACVRNVWLGIIKENNLVWFNALKEERKEDKEIQHNIIKLKTVRTLPKNPS